jgi:L-amino acid N-acyltransferase YncA
LSELVLRTARPEDIGVITAIYAHHVLHGFGTFEKVPPSPDQMAERMAAILKYGLPYTVALRDDQILAYAYASPFRLRAAYRYTVEDSIYVDPEAVGTGIGKALLGSVLDDCTALGLRQVIGVIGDSENAGSIGLHKALGFEMMTTLTGVGYKHGRWVNSVWMQKPLNGGTDTAPDAPGLDLNAV